MELVLDPATAGVPDADLATVYWDSGLYRIDDFSEPPNSRQSAFWNRFARLSPGEHHFFMDLRHHNSDWEYNWLFADLVAGHRYRLERGESRGFMQVHTQWTLRDLETRTAVAASIDCHNGCRNLLEDLWRMHLQEREAVRHVLTGPIAVTYPGGFEESHAHPDLDGSSAHVQVADEMSRALSRSGFRLTDSGEDAALRLTIRGLSFYPPDFSSFRFPALGLKGGAQVWLRFEVEMTAADGNVLDAWLISVVGEQPGIADNPFTSEREQRAMSDASVRAADRLVKDLERRLRPGSG